MKLIYIRMLGAFFALAMLTAAARGQAIDQLSVNIPYEFVVAGKTLPAGTYKIGRIDNQNPSELAISSFENRTGVLVISQEIEQARDEQPRLTFELVGGQHILSSIETAEHIFRLPVSASAASLVAKRQNAPSSSGTSGSN